MNYAKTLRNIMRKNLENLAYVTIFLKRQLGIFAKILQ